MIKLNNQSADFYVKPRSALDIRGAANSTRAYAQSLLKDGNTALNIVKTLDLLQHEEWLSYEVLEDSEFGPDIEAYADPKARVIYLKEYVLEGATAGDGRSRFTLAHELGHVILGHEPLFPRSTAKIIKPYENAEWQANTFAADLLAPMRLISPDDTVALVMMKFGVSAQCAEVSLNKRLAIVQKEKLGGKK